MPYREFFVYIRYLQKRVIDVKFIQINLKGDVLMKSKIARKILSIGLAGAIIGTAFAGMSTLSISADAAERTDYGLAETSQKGVILHCWNWSYKNIKKYMKDIAAAGYTSVQTSPVQQPKDYYWEGVAYGNVGIPDGTGGYEGNWWKAYQPVTFSICNNGHTWYGNKQEFKEMCAEAEKYGVKVIVDIVANHMGNIQGWKIGDVETVMGDISPQVGEFWEPKMLTDSSYWHISTSWTHSSDERFDVTQGNMGMPDLNTGDSKVQQMVLGLLKECIDCGADGFRFDAAKHIETPKDNAKFASNFWDVVLDGARAYYKQKNGYDGIYFYGEVLNRIDDTNAENYYLSKMSLTDNSTSDNLRNSVVHGQVSALATSGYCGYIHGKADHAVMWAESHDTYMGGGSSYDANDSDIKKTWAILASRKDATGLFFARPYYSKDILAGDVSKARQSYATILENVGGEQTQLGDVGTLTWADPAVVAANRFRNFFVGQSEKLGSSGNTVYNMRGTTGVVIVRGDGAGAVSLSIGMKDGTYTDRVTGEKFTVSGGRISGTIKNKDGIAVVYNPTVNYGAVNPEKPTVLRINAKTADEKNVFMTNKTNVTITAEGANSVKYTTSEGATGSFTGTSKTVSIGSLTATGSDVTLTVTATAADGTSKTKSFIYSKKAPVSDYPTLNKGGVVFDNSTYKWGKVYCYVYDESGSSVVNNASWPGEAMTDEGDFWTYEFPSKFTGNVQVIFNNNSGVQYPTGSGLSMKATDKKLFTNGALGVLPESTGSLTLTLTPSASKVGVNQSVTFTAKATSNSGTVKYSFTTSDGKTQAASTSNKFTWTPTKTGTYTIAVNGVDNNSDITAVTKVTVTSGSVLVNNSTLSAVSINLGDTVTAKCAASGGKAPYTYAVLLKKTSETVWSSAQDFSSNATVSMKPLKATDYRVCVKVKDSAGTIEKKYFDVAVKDVSLKNTSTLSASSINLGSTLTAKCSASGGKAPYTYAVLLRKTSETVWTSAQDFSSNAAVSMKPLKATDYRVCVKVRDSEGTIAKKYFDVTVKDTGLKNTSVLSATSVKLGSKVTAKCSATGGKSPYTYAVYVKKTSDTSWTTKQSFKSNASVVFTSMKATSYNVCIKVKDSTGTIAKKYIELKVTN